MWLPTGGSVRVDPADADRTGWIERAASPTIFALTALCAVVVVVAGWGLSEIGGATADRFGFTESAVGALGIAVVTSLPELVTTVAAVRRGALGLAFGGIMGGNAFDVLFLAASDVAYTNGSIYHAAGDAVWFQLALTCTMVAILVLGLTMRQRKGPANIGFESVLVLGCYLLGATALIAWPGD